MLCLFLVIVHLVLHLLILYIQLFGVPPLFCQKEVVLIMLYLLMIIGGLLGFICFIFDLIFLVFKRISLKWYIHNFRLELKFFV